MTDREKALYADVAWLKGVLEGRRNPSPRSHSDKVLEDAVREVMSTARAFLSPPEAGCPGQPGHGYVNSGCNCRPGETTCVKRNGVCYSDPADPSKCWWCGRVLSAAKAPLTECSKSPDGLHKRKPYDIGTCVYCDAKVLAVRV